MSASHPSEIDTKEDNRSFEELTDEEAKWCAWAIGIPSWKNREDLNRQWNEVMESFKRHG